MAANNDLKLENIQKVRECFYEGNILTKTEIAGLTNLSLALTTNILQLLLESKEILYIGDANSTGGRKSKQYCLNQDYCHIGLMNLVKESGKYVIYAYSYNLANQIYAEIKTISSLGNMDEVLQTSQRLINEDNLIKVLTISLPGVCVDGIVDVCDYEALQGENLVATLEVLLNIPVIVENDVNVACIGFSHDHPNIQHLAMIYQPAQDYVGCGIVLNGKLYNGFSHFAGELRYLPFMSHELQDQMLKDHPEDLILKQMATLVTVMNPQMIGYVSDVFEELTHSLVEYGIPAKHCPILVHIDDLNVEIQKGLYSIGLNYLKEKGRNKNEN